jgi:hypothetical protein
MSYGRRVRVLAPPNGLVNAVAFPNANVGRVEMLTDAN